MSAGILRRCTLILAILTAGCSESNVDDTGHEPNPDTGLEASLFEGAYVGPFSMQIDMHDGPIDICTGAVALEVDQTGNLFGAGACALTFGYMNATMRLSFGGEVVEDATLDAMVRQTVQSTEVGKGEWLLPTGTEYTLQGGVDDDSLDADWTGTLYTAFGAYTFTAVFSAEKS